MRILIDLQSCQSGSRRRGIGRYANSITRAMLREAVGRHEFHILLSDRYPDDLVEIRRDFKGLIPNENIIVAALPEQVASAMEENAWRTRAAELALAKVVEDLEPDVYFNPSLFEGFREPTVASIERLACRTATTLYDLIPYSDSEIYLGDPALRRAYHDKLASLRRCDTIFAISEFTRAEAIRLLGLAPEQVTYVPLAASSRFAPVVPTDSERAQLFDRYGIRGRFVITTAPLEPRKNLDGLLAGFSRLEPALRSELQLVVVGQTDDSARRKIAEVAEVAGLAPEEYVIAGFVPDDDLAALYSTCELMVFPSLSEGFGLPPLEAMACGAAVAVSNLTSLPEVVGRSDIQFDPHDPSDMARVMAAILTDLEFRDELKTYGLARARRYSWRKSAKAVLAGLERLPIRRTISVPNKAGFSPGARVGVIGAISSGGAARSAKALQSLLHGLSKVCTVELAMLIGDIGSSPMLEALPRHDLANLMMMGGRFDRLLYFVESDTMHLIVDYVAARPGAIVVVETDVTSKTDVGRLSPTQQADLFAWGHFRALSAAADDPALAERTAGAMFSTRIPILAEAGSCLVRNGRARAWAISKPAAGEIRRRSKTAVEANGDCMIEAVLDALTSAPAPSTHDRLMQLPFSVNGVTPTDSDIDDLALVVSKNASIRRSADIFLDVSGLATLKGPRLPLVRQLLRDMLVCEPGCKPIHFRNREAVSANRLGGRLLGFPDFPHTDHEIVLRSGDKVVCLDLIGGAAFDPSLLTDLTAQGVSVCVAAVETILAERSDLSDVVALAILNAASAAVSAVDGEVLLGGAHEPKEEKRPDSTINVPLSQRATPMPTWLALGGRESLFTLREQYDGIIPEHIRVLQNDVQKTLLDRRSAAAPVRPAPKANYTILGHVRGIYSLAIVNRAMASALEVHLEGRVAFTPYENAPVEDLSDVPAGEQALISRLAGRTLPTDGLDVVVSHHYPVLPPSHTPDLALALFHWEETAVPRRVVEHLQRHFGAVLAPSESVRKALIDSGLHIPVARVGLPSDLRLFEGGQVSQTQEEKVFLHVSSCFPRKGVDVLLKAWATAFAPEDAVRLIIKTFPNPHNDVEAQIAALRHDGADFPPIEIIFEDMDQKALAGLYARADVVVLPSRGEGYNLPALEAMASGTSLIVTAYGGQRDFCGPWEARLLDYVFAPSASHVAGGHALWVEPSVDDLVRALREQVDPDKAESIETRRVQAKAKASQVGRSEEWVARLERMTTDLLISPSTPRPRTAWVTSWGIRCGVAEYSAFLLSASSAEARASTFLLSDRRTPPGSGMGLAHESVWTIGGNQHLDDLLEALEDHAAEAVVIQHQDGLIRWTVLGELLQDERLQGRVVVVFLHAASNIQTLLTEDEREIALVGLRCATRIVVHNLADINLLKSYGLVDNVTLLPHGAMPGGVAPLIRALPPSARPIIGCHGFFLNHKRIDRLISALPALRRIWPGVRLRLVNANYPGESDHLIAASHTLAETLKVDDAIDWHTDFLPVEKITALLAGCDLVVLPYDHSRDSASGAVRVSMSSLAPVLTTDVNIFAELRDVVAQVEGNAPSQLASAITALLKDSQRRADIQKAMQAWLEHHDWERIADTLDGMIRGLFDAQQRGWD